MPDEHFWLAAADYIARGWPAVLTHAAPGGRCTCGRTACRNPGKHPVGREWAANAIRDAEGLAKARAAAGDREHNLALLLGEEAGIVDVEFDNTEGEATAARLLADSKTPAYTSARSTHRLFRWSPALGAKAVHHVAGLEVRAGGGGKATSSMVPPSRHATGVDYAWLPGLSPAEVELACFPEAVLELLRAPLTTPTRELEFTVIADLESDPGAAAGSRREALAKLVGSHLKQHGVTADLMPLVTAWCRRCTPAFPEDEAAALVNSLVTKELMRSATSSATSTPPQVAAKPKLRLRPLAEVEHKPDTYILGSHWPLGKLALLAADGGLGKTMLICEVAARLSRGEPTPLRGDITDCETLIVSAEDDESTIRARCELLGGNLSRIYTLAEEEAFESFGSDSSRLGEALNDLPDVRLLVFDTMPDFMGRVDDHKNKEVRHAAQGIRDLAKRRDLAVVGISHFNKGGSTSGAKLLGSVAYRNLPRSVAYILRDPDDEDCRLLFHEKRNGPIEPTWRYRMKATPAGVTIEWEPAPTKLERHEVERMLVSPTSGGDRTYRPTKLEQATAILAKALEPGVWTSTADLFAVTDAAGLSRSTVQEAASRLRVQKSQGQWRVAEHASRPA